MKDGIGIHLSYDHHSCMVYVTAFICHHSQRLLKCQYLDLIQHARLGMAELATENGAIVPSCRDSAVTLQTVINY